MTREHNSTETYLVRISREIGAAVSSRSADRLIFNHLLADIGSLCSDRPGARRQRLESLPEVHSAPAPLATKLFRDEAPLELGVRRCRLVSLQVLVRV
jgi:hypothetical protein